MVISACEAGSVSCQLDPAFLPPQPLYVADETATTTLTGWELSPQPFQLSAGQYEAIQRLGNVLWRFSLAQDRLYNESLKGRQPAWVADILNQGKPESLLRFAAMKRFKQSFPLVIRPDLLLVEDGDFRLTEVDSVPGGLGFISALNEAYRQSGCSVIESEATLPMTFLAMLKAEAARIFPDVEAPFIAMVVSDEAADYRRELTFLVDKIRENYPNVVLVHPRDLDLVRDELVMLHEGQEQRVHLIYRFFELFDLPNIPKIELIQYAIKKGLVACTPVFKPYLEDKAWLALIHHPVLSAFWKQELGEADFDWLRGKIPQGWILDPAPLPPQAVIHNLTLSNQAVQSFEALMSASQKERQLVVKPTGFSPLAWGSRGVTIGHDVSGEGWQEALQAALKSYGTTPYILQQFHKPVAHPAWQLDLTTNTVREFSGRTRLCPYFLVQPTPDKPAEATITLSGILATTCPADKKIIHGMRDAIMAPCQVVAES